MKWLLLVIVASVDGEFTVNVLSAHDTIAECHVAGTFLAIEEKLNREALCFPTDTEVEMME